MNRKRVSLLVDTENKSLIIDNEDEFSYRYKCFGDTIIRADKQFCKLYKKTLHAAHIGIFPAMNLKSWGVFLLKAAGLKEKKRKRQYFFGIGIHWFFTKKQYLPLQADVIYQKPNTAILIYTSPKDKFVVKAAFTKYEQNRLKNEILFQRAARKIPSGEVIIPEIIQEYHIENFSFKKETYFPGKKLRFGIGINLKKIYKKVFTFMIDFYMAHPVSERYIGEVFQKNQDVLDFIASREQGRKIIRLFKNLVLQDKKVVLLQTHGDLNHFNILRYCGNLVIIDWGESEHTLIYKDFYNSSYYPKKEYEVLIERAGLKEELLYNFDEQLFIGKFIAMHDYISGRWNNGKPSEKVPRRMKSDIKRLMKIISRGKL